MTTIKQIIAVGRPQVRKLTEAERKARDDAHNARMARNAERQAKRQEKVAA